MNIWLLLASIIFCLGDSLAFSHHFRFTGGSICKRNITILFFGSWVIFKSGALIRILFLQGFFHQSQFQLAQSGLENPVLGEELIPLPRDERQFALEGGDDVGEVPLGFDQVEDGIVGAAAAHLVHFVKYLSVMLIFDTPTLILEKH